MLASLPDATRVQLKPPTLEAFDKYMQAAQARFDNSLHGGAFLWVDASTDRKRAVSEGKILAEPSNQSGDIEIPDGLIHDWTGAVFVPGATLALTLRMMEDYDNHKNIYRPEVIDSRLLSHHDDDFHVYLRILKKQILTVVLNTEHDVHYARLDRTRWYSRSSTTRVAEVEDPGPNEHELPPGNDHGFMWRLNTFWKIRGARRRRVPGVPGHFPHPRRPGWPGLADQPHHSQPAARIAHQYAQSHPAGADAGKAVKGA